MKELISFDYMGNGVRTVFVDGEPWWVAKDVCAILGYASHGDNLVQILQRLDGDEKSQISISSNNNPVSNFRKPVWCVNEPGLYSLILWSRVESAKAFKRWVTHEVLPQIRKAGKYLTTRAKSKEVRNAFTAVLKQHGYDKPVEYATTTKHMKEIICLDGVSKDTMTPDQLKKTMVSELLAELQIKHTGAFGYKQVDPVCIDSCRNVVAFVEGTQ